MKRELPAPQLWVTSMVKVLSGASGASGNTMKVRASSHRRGNDGASAVGDGDLDRALRPGHRDRQRLFGIDVDRPVLRREVGDRVVDSERIGVVTVFGDHDPGAGELVARIPVERVDVHHARGHGAITVAVVVATVIAVRVDAVEQGLDGVGVDRGVRVVAVPAAAGPAGNAVLVAVHAVHAVAVVVLVVADLVGGARMDVAVGVVAVVAAVSEVVGAVAVCVEQVRAGAVLVDAVVGDVDRVRGDGRSCRRSRRRHGDGVVTPSRSTSDQVAARAVLVDAVVGHLVAPGGRWRRCRRSRRAPENRRCRHRRAPRGRRRSHSPHRRGAGRASMDSSFTSSGNAPRAPDDLRHALQHCVTFSFGGALGYAVAP